jgi:prepilin-type N-terminal cleavage/methylation domain-containing protein/prepilin-type processing-associated H-X9-DG protein
MVRLRRKQGGFTLIELLVVIAIIAILAAILFPVFAQAREKARSSSCLSNQKQIALAFNMYSQDYDETYPIGLNQNIIDPISGVAQRWEDSVKPYIKGGNVGGILTCPSAPSRAYAYSMNGWLSAKSQASAGNAADTILTADAVQVYPTVAGITPVAGDSKSLPISGPIFSYSVTGGETYWVPKPNFKAPKLDVALANATIDPTTQFDLDDKKALGQMRYRHTSGVNASFVDGHTKFVRMNASKLSQWNPDFQIQ